MPTDVGPNIEIEIIEIVCAAENWPGPEWSNHGFLFKNPTDGRTKWSWQFDHPDGNGATSYGIDTDPWTNTTYFILEKEVKRGCETPSVTS